MKTGFLSFCLAAAMSILPTPEPARATGLFLNLPTYYGRIDTARVILDIGQSFVEGEYENSTVFSFETGFRSGERTRVRMQIQYPVLRQQGGYDHGFADLLLNAELMVVGDSLRISGLFFRGDMRIPTGSASLRPYAGESLDGGAGFEFRKLSETFDFRCSATYILAGLEIEEEFYRADNYALAGVLLGLKPFRSLTVDFSAFAQFFKNGDFREVYQLAAGTRLKGGLDVRISGGIDTGGSIERVWNSMFQIGITWRFPAAWKREYGPEDAPTEGTAPGTEPSGDVPTGTPLPETPPPETPPPENSPPDKTTP